VTGYNPDDRTDRDDRADVAAVIERVCVTRAVYATTIWDDITEELMPWLAERDHVRDAAVASRAELPPIACNCRFHDQDHWRCSPDCGCDGPRAGWQWKQALVRARARSDA
jgi:hypothetical protein